MRLLEPCKEYIGFDDRKMIIIGIIVLSTITHPIITDIPFIEFLSTPSEIITSIAWTTVYWLVLRWAMIFLRKKFPHINETPKRLLFSTLTVLLIAPVIGQIVGHLCYVFLKPEFDLETPQRFVLIYILAFGILAIYEASFFFHQYKRAIIETEELKTAQIQSQLENLRNQISPHFLFNSLNTLMNLIPKDQDRAMSYLSKLSKFYRYTVSNQDESLVPISTEVENAMTFADLLHERFRDNITINIECTDAGGKMTLPLSLQLLIENAVKHNIVSKSKPLHINIYCGEDGYIHVENNLQLKIQAVSSTGSGLDNIKKRFAYFTDKSIVIKKTNGQYHISLPLIDRQ